MSNSGSSSEKMPQVASAQSGAMKAGRASGIDARTVLLCAVVCAGIVVFGYVANEHYPLREWLFFMFARYWLVAGLFMAASLAAGLRITRWLFPESLPPGERFTFAITLGVLTFVLGTFVGGYAGLIGRVFFFAWPALLLGFGARQAWHELAPIRRDWRRLGWSQVMPKTLPQVLGALLLVLSLVAIYLQVMTPLNVGGDSYWYHLPIAEHYVASGAIRPFAEGWYLGAYPHLASLLYTWAFMSPGELFDHVALSSHIEWALFLATLGGVAVLTRRLLGGQRVPFAAAVLFLFPGIFLYDSSLITGADHILAFWAPALAIALLRTLKDFSVKESAVAGAILGAAILTKYQASYYFVPTALLLVYLIVRRRRIKPAVACALACLVVSSAHWLKNWIAYGDPFYPLLYKYLPDHPFHAGAGDLMYWDAQFLLKGTPWEKVKQTLLALPTFAFIPHNWEGMHGNRPVFGSLFTLMVPVLVFLRNMKRTWLLVVAVHLGIVVWFVTTHQDRYLQALVPWMTAATAAALFVAWQQGRAVRLALTVLVALQLVWGADVYFIRTHSMIGDSPLKALVDYMALGQEGRYAEHRKLHFGSLQKVGAELPPHAKVLLHEKHDRLGLGAASIADTLCWQGAVDYAVLDRPDAAAALWRQMGATHVMWWADLGMPWHDYMAREAVFARTVDLWGGDVDSIDDKRLTKLRSEPRDKVSSASPTKIAWLGCGDDPALALYTPRGLIKREPDSPIGADALRDNPHEAMAAANAVILRGSCGGYDKAREELSSHFKRIDRSDGLDVWVRP
jgi:hypothetical protein